MNFYCRITASFWYNNEEYPLYSTSINEYDDSVEIITTARHPDIKRGCIGNLVLTGVNGANAKAEQNVPILNDYHYNILLSKIQVYSAEPDSPPAWKYIFLKE